MGHQPKLIGDIINELRLEATVIDGQPNLIAIREQLNKLRE